MKKFYSIEILRFLSSFAIILYHYKLFFSPLNKNSNIIIDENNLSNLPFYNLLEIFYEKGHYAVSIFWCVSGFVFALVYLEQNNNIAGKDFFIKRFARLYPLHFLTLFLTLFFQYLNFKYLNVYQFDLLNDFYHFFLNVFFISSWGFENGHSFNGPIWSVSTEILIYFLFFLFIKFAVLYRIHFLILFLIVSTLFYKLFKNDLAHSHLLFLICFQLFFSGVLVFVLFQNKYFYRHLFSISIVLLFLSLIGNFKIFLFCPGLVMFFISAEKYLNNQKINNYFHTFGNMTYAMYLLHTPFQMLIVFFFGVLKIYNIYLTYTFFFVYVALIITMSYLFFILYEKKMNLFIMRKYKYNNK